MPCSPSRANHYALLACFSPHSCCTELQNGRFQKPYQEGRGCPKGNTAGHLWQSQEEDQDLCDLPQVSPNFAIELAGADCAGGSG